MICRIADVFFQNDNFLLKLHVFIMYVYVDILSFVCTCHDNYVTLRRRLLTNPLVAETRGVQHTTTGKISLRLVNKSGVNIAQVKVQIES